MEALDELRAYISKTAPFHGEQAGRKTGLEAFDHLLGDLPKGLTILTGPPGVGRLTLAAQITARETKAHRPVAWIDAKGTLYPPALMNAGVDLSRVLMVKSSDPRIMYAAEQIVGAGTFGIVVATGLDNHLTAPRARRLQTTAEARQVSVLLVLEKRAAERTTNAVLKLRLSRKRDAIVVDVEKDRSGRATGRRGLVTFA